jgi:hypothetical protein
MIVRLNLSNMSIIEIIAKLEIYRIDNTLEVAHARV